MEHRILLVRDAEDRLQSLLLQKLGNLRFRAGGYLRCVLFDSQGRPAALTHVTPQCAVALRLPIAVGEDGVFRRTGEAADEATIAAQLGAMLVELEEKALLLLPHLEDYQVAPEALQATLAAIQQLDVPMLVSYDPAVPGIVGDTQLIHALQADTASADFLPLLQNWLEACRAKARSDRYDHAYKQHYDNEASRPQNQQPEKKKRTLLSWKPRELYED